MYKHFWLTFLENILFNFSYKLVPSKTDWIVILSKSAHVNIKLRSLAGWAYLNAGNLFTFRKDIYNL